MIPKGPQSGGFRVQGSSFGSGFRVHRSVLGSGFGVSFGVPVRGSRSGFWFIERENRNREPEPRTGTENRNPEQNPEPQTENRTMNPEL
jgi:hypothetical protein